MLVTSLEFFDDYAPLSFDSEGIVATPEDLQGKMELMQTALGTEPREEIVATYALLSFDLEGIVATTEDLQGLPECLAWVVN
jgi:hypothetical protein